MKQKLEPLGMEVKAQNTYGGNHSYWKKFHAKSDKRQITFFCTPVSKFQKISTLDICDGACFSKVATHNFSLLHFLKQSGFCSFIHSQQGFRTQTPLVAAFVAKIDQKKQKDALRIFLQKHNDPTKQK